MEDSTGAVVVVEDSTGAVVIVEDSTGAVVVCSAWVCVSLVGLQYIKIRKTKINRNFTI